MEIIEYCYRNKKGNINKLNELYDEHDVRGLLVIGYLKTTIDSRGNVGWKITQSLIDDCRFKFGKPTFIEKICGLFVHYFLRY
jgi:hypothetical protein